MSSRRMTFASITSSSTSTACSPARWRWRSRTRSPRRPTSRIGTHTIEVTRDRRPGHARRARRSRSIRVTAVHRHEGLQRRRRLRDGRLRAGARPAGRARRASAASNPECLSMLCADGGEPLNALRRGVQRRDEGQLPERASTASSAGATGVCWPRRREGGCCDAGGSAGRSCSARARAPSRASPAGDGR